MLRVVHDTNVAVSALLFRAGRLAWLRDARDAGTVVPLVCRSTVAELEQVLLYPKFDLDVTTGRHCLRSISGGPRYALIPALPYACRVAATKMTGSFCVLPTPRGRTRLSRVTRISLRSPLNRVCESLLRLSCVRSLSHGLAGSRSRVRCTG